jgi:thymidylate synthase (FAD)
VKVMLVSHTANPEQVIEMAARNCYKSEPKGVDAGRRLIASCIRRGHDSVIEHASVTFAVEGISRACSHQLVRHRIASYSQESQRYVDPTKGAMEWIVPESIRENSLALQTYNDLLADVERTYRELCGAFRIPKQDARFVLPNACPTSIHVTMNFRALRNFLRLRLDKHAQWEIRAMAREMLQLVMDVAPTVFDDIATEQEALEG